MMYDMQQQLREAFEEALRRRNLTPHAAHQRFGISRESIRKMESGFAPALPQLERWALAAAGLPRIRFHDLRHTSSTLMLDSGVPIATVQERLGHSSPLTTLGIYGHSLPGSDEAAASTISRLLGERCERPLAGSPDLRTEGARRGTPCAGRNPGAGSV